MSDISSFLHALLWRERVLRSVANLIHADAEELLELVPRVRSRPRSKIFPLVEANEALARLRRGKLRGSAVLITG